MEKAPITPMTMESIHFYMRDQSEHAVVPNSAFFAGYYGDDLVTVANTPEVMKAIVANFKACLEGWKGP